VCQHVAKGVIFHGGTKQPAASKGARNRDGAAHSDGDDVPGGNKGMARLFDDHFEATLFDDHFTATLFDDNVMAMLFDDHVKASNTRRIFSGR
jgi:hypothetical protein